MKLQTALFFFLSKFCASKSGVRLIYGCGLYTDVYGKYVLDRQTLVSIIQALVSVNYIIVLPYGPTHLREI